MPAPLACPVSDTGCSSRGQLGRGLLVAAATALAGCNNGGTGAVVPLPIGEPPPFSAIALFPEARRTLERPVRILCSDPIDGASLPGASIVGTDGSGAGVPSGGEWRVRSLINGPVANTILEFVPSLPAPEAAGGLQPDTQYVVTLRAGALRSADGRPLATAASFSFRTVIGLAAEELYGAGAAGGPHAVAIRPSPLDGEGRLRLGRVADDPAVIRVDFDQPIEHAIVNIPRQSTAAARGAVWLAYDDPQLGPDRVVEASVIVERNAYDGAAVLLRPQGVLPNNALLRVFVGPGLRDIAGETDPVGTTTLVGTVASERAYEAQFAALALSLRDAAIVPPIAGAAAVFDGAVLRGGEHLPGTQGDGGDVGDWEPYGPIVILGTDVDVLQFTDGRRREYRGGVFVVRNLYVPLGTLVRGGGPNPLVFVVLGDARIDGTISVRGGDAPWSTGGFGQYRGPGDVGVNPRLYPLTISARGRGTCGGSDGAESSAAISIFHNGHGLQGAGVPFGGGYGGQLACSPCARGSGGGGGTFTTAGDPGYPADPGAGASGFRQRLGIGGSGCAGLSSDPARSLAGGAAGPAVLFDLRGDNDFFGIGYDPRRAVSVHGELVRLRGGTGGGSGGDQTVGLCAPGNAPFASRHGGGGGAGGGALMLRVAGRLEVGPSAHLDANGGHGAAGGLGTGVSTGGGGGGSGGMVVLMAGERLRLHTHGETFANRDYDFSVTADGGVCTAMGLLGPSVASKYPSNGQPLLPGSQYDSRPLGGFGGFGVIQLLAPLGDNEDGTNTVLDDGIDLLQDGLPMLQTQKIRYLAWRGLADETGFFSDDFGNPTGFAWGEGDMRPSPVLLPVPFGPRTQAHTGWAALGAVARRQLAAPDDGARGVVVGSIPVGPDFAGDFGADGWLRFLREGSRWVPGGNDILPVPVAIDAIDSAPGAANTTYLVRLRESVLGGVPDRHIGALALLRGGDGSVLAFARVLAHDTITLRLHASVPLPPGPIAMSLRHFPVDLADWSIASYRGADGQSVPRANVRVGFAFHRDPERAASSGIDANRLPQEVGTWLYRLDDVTTVNALRAFGATHVQCQLTIDRRWRRNEADQPPIVDELSNLAVRAVWLPFRF